MEAGEIWAYGTSETPYWFRAFRVHKVEEGRVVGSFLDDDGVEEKRKKVYRSYLRVLWDDRWEYLQAARIRKADYEAEDDAATVVFDELIPDDIASLEFGTTRMTIDDAEALAALSGLTVDRLNSDSIDCYQVARAVMAAHPDGVLRRLGHEERALHLETVLKAKNSDAWWYYSDERRMETAALEAGRRTERRDSVLRMWAGQEAVDVAAENRRLRVELLAIRMVVADAIDALERDTKTVRAKRHAAILRERLSAADDLAESAESPQEVRKGAQADNTSQP
jgi:hypothetical protein